jgi:hypothetical protein
MILIKCGSHRARDKIFSIIGKKKELCLFERSVGHGTFKVTKSEYEKVINAKIKGVSKMKDGDDLFPCCDGK